MRPRLGGRVSYDYIIVGPSLVSCTTTRCRYLVSPL